MIDSRNFTKAEYIDSEITGKVIGCAMRVHSALGNGFQEVVYQRSIGIEMREEGIQFSREHEMSISNPNSWALGELIFW